jgi:hypothetical protein
MQLSREEYLRISQVRADFWNRQVAAASLFASSPLQYGELAENLFSTRAEEARHLANSLTETSEIREDIVASLRSRIESGSYDVSGEAVAEMIFRRCIADQVR